MELYGIIFFSVAYIFGSWQLAAEKKALDIDRRSLWKKGEALLKMEKELDKKPKGFDWQANLPMIMQFLKGNNLDLSQLSSADPDEIQKLISDIDGGK